MIAAQAEEAKKLQENARVQTFVNSLEVILLFLIDVIEDCLPATNKFLRQLIVGEQIHIRSANVYRCTLTERCNMNLDSIIS
jgi:hypothetical protein